MKKRFVLGLVAIFFAIACCEKEYNIFIPEDEPCIHGDTTIIIYQYDNLRFESVETDDSTEYCSFGQVSFNVYRNDSLISSTVYCKDSMPSQENCPDQGDYFYSTEEGTCDTAYLYDCDWKLKLKIPICKPDTVYLPGDTITIVERDTITVVEIDTVIITERDTITIVDHDTVVVTLPGDTVIVTNEKYYALSKYVEDCNSGYSEDAVKRGWYVEGDEVLGPYSINPLYSKTGKGSMVSWDYQKNPAIIWCPKFEPSGLKETSFQTASKNPMNIKFFVMHENGAISEMPFSMETSPVNNFVWDDTSTYKYNFFYNPNLSDIQYWDIVRWGILVENVWNNPVPDCGQFNTNCDWRNWVYNGRKFEWTILVPLKK
jgi:hypothetical protein